MTIHHKEPAVAARAFGLETHPWGVPDWIGLRVKARGEPRTKAYHAVERLDDRFELPDQWPRDLQPIMASLDGDAVEIYLRKRGACEWPEWAERCLSPLGPYGEPPEVTPRPRPRERAFCVGARRERGRLSAITLYADWRALPRDPEIERVWSAGLGEEDRMAYRLALAGARELGVLPAGNWHRMLAWTVEAGGERHRAVSLAVPRV